MRFRIKKRNSFRPSPAIGKDRKPNGPGSKDYVVYDDLTGWKTYASRVKFMSPYSGFGGLVADTSNFYTPSAHLIPFTPPVEKPIPWARSAPVDTGNAAPPFTGSNPYDGGYN